MSDKLSILIVGGYGTFGGRLVELLENKPELKLIVAGRSSQKSRIFCRNRGHVAAELVPAKFDRNGDLDTQILALGPNVIVDASGPFQYYGTDGYALVEACIRHKLNYLDLADGADFVNNISQFNNAAREANIFILAGVSSFPVLTGCVIRQISAEMSKLGKVIGGIAPSPYAKVGNNVIKAVAGYSGKPMNLLKNRKSIKPYAITETFRYTISVPGYVPLKSTLFSLVDVPDHGVLPVRFTDIDSIWIGAGPTPEIFHRLLIWLAWLVRLKVIKSLLPLAGLMRFVTKYFKWGEHRGGMFIDVEGFDKQAKPVKISWHLLAEGDDGPYIPCMAIEAVIANILAGKMPITGARTAIDDLVLGDFEKIFDQRTIFTGFRSSKNLTNQCLYQQVLGTAWDKLPAEIQTMHAGGEHSFAVGFATIQRGKNPLAGFVCWLIGFPKTNENIELSVEFKKIGSKEIWVRKFGDDVFSSQQYAGKGRDEYLLIERFGAASFYMALVLDSANKLNLVIRKWKFLGLKMPMWLAPKIYTFEYVKDEKFHFNVKISLPIMGDVVHYRGWLVEK